MGLDLSTCSESQGPLDQIIHVVDSDSNYNESGGFGFPRGKWIPGVPRVPEHFALIQLIRSVD